MEKSERIKEMQSLLKIKLKYFRMFYDISIQQKDIVAQDGNGQSQKKTIQSINNSKIESLLLKKDNIISKILELEKRVEFMLKNDTYLKSKLADDSIIKSFNQQIKEIIDKTVPVEKEVASILEKHKKLLKEHVGTVRQGKTILMGYGGQKIIKPRFVDYKLQ